MPNNVHVYIPHRHHWQLATTITMLGNNIVMPQEDEDH